MRNKRAGPQMPTTKNIAMADGLGRRPNFSEKLNICLHLGQNSK